MGLKLLVVGIIGVGAAAVITQQCWKRAGLRTYDQKHASAGKGIVPRWVSLVNILGWIAIALGLGQLICAPR